MSYDLIIYAKRANLPGRAALEKRFAAELVLKNEISWSGFFPMQLDKRTTGCELHLSPITEADRRDYEEDLRASGEEDHGYREILNASDCQVTVSCKDDLSLAAGRAFATAVASLAGGYVRDPQTGRSELVA